MRTRNARLPPPVAVESPSACTAIVVVPGLPAAPVKIAKSLAAVKVTALVISALVMLSTLPPEGPSKSKTPSNAETGSSTIAVGSAVVMIELSARLIVIRLRS